jgi:hypothetical protein
MLRMCVYMHSRFVENHSIQILEDKPLISEMVLSHCTSDLKLVMLKNMILCQKIYLCKILFMFYDSNGFKPYICFDFHNLSVRKTLAPRIGYLEAIPAYERNMLDALMKPVHFDMFVYIMDEIWNIATNPLRSCGFAPYIQYMIETVAHEKFYKDVRHDSLRPAVPKDPRAPHASSSTAAATPSHTTCSGGANSTLGANSGILKMLYGIFAMCRCRDQPMDVMDQCLHIVYPPPPS